MTKLRLRRIIYFVICIEAIAFWAMYGSFEAIQAPYVGF